MFVKWETVTEGDDVVELPGGAYWYQSETNIPERLTPFDLRLDQSIDLPGPSEKLSNEIKKFLAHKLVYDELGCIYKLGILAYGPPGNSKSLSLRKIIKEVVSEDAVVIFIPGEVPSSEFLFKIKETLDSRLKVFVFEEFSTGLNDKYQVSCMLTFLDGELSPNNSIIIATTNYPEELPANMVDRPSRFDKLFKFDNPDEKSRRILIGHFMKRPAEDAEVVASKGLSIAAIKEACIRTHIDKTSFVAVCKNLKERTTLCKKAFAKPIEAMGFGQSEIEDEKYHF